MGPKWQGPATADSWSEARSPVLPHLCVRMKLIANYQNLIWEMGRNDLKFAGWLGRMSARCLTPVTQLPRGARSRKFPGFRAKAAHREVEVFPALKPVV